MRLDAICEPAGGDIGGANAELQRDEAEAPDPQQRTEALEAFPGFARVSHYFNPLVTYPQPDRTWTALAVLGRNATRVLANVFETPSADFVLDRECRPHLVEINSKPGVAGFGACPGMPCAAARPTLHARHSTIVPAKAGPLRRRTLSPRRARTDSCSS